MPDGNDRYREAARKIYGRDGVRIPTHGLVQQMADGGAFVEAILWVPDADAQQPSEGSDDGSTRRS